MKVIEKAEKFEVLPEVAGCLENESVEISIDSESECHVEAPAIQEMNIKPKRKYEWKGERNRKRSKEHNAKIAKALTGRSLSEEHRQNIAESMIGNQNFK